MSGKAPEKYIGENRLFEVGENTSCWSEKGQEKGGGLTGVHKGREKRSSTRNRVAYKKRPPTGESQR